MINYIMTSMDSYIFSSLIIRIVLAFLTTFLLSVFLGKKTISLLRHKQGKGQPIREDGPQSHLLTKKGTPTMGGLLIIATTVVSCILWAKWSNIFVLTSLAVLLIYAFVGFLDDYEKVTKQTSNAMSAKMKLLLQFSVSFICVLIVSYATPDAIRYDVKIPSVYPFLNNFTLNLSWFYIPFAMVVIAGSSNAVNLTDGLDGLAAGLLTTIFLFFIIICLETSFSISGTQEVAIICSAVAGACLGFLWFNCSPAKVFMGDTGSLALGALLGTISVITKSEIILAIVGLIFVVEALSVMIQIFWFKKTGKRFFKMAPIHHHFEQIGIAENTIVVRFWIVGILLAAFGLIAVY